MPQALYPVYPSDTELDEEAVRKIYLNAGYKIMDIVAASKRIYPGNDKSYYLTGDDAGQLNAFEEYAVRVLTKDVMNGDYPNALLSYLKGLL